MERTNRNSKDLRIAIIGAGPAGLSAAEALREKGYTNVTILEKANRVGGMSLSLTYPTATHGEMTYELGSLQPVSSKQFFRLLKRYDLHIGKKNKGWDSNPNKPIYLKIYSFSEHRAVIDFSRYQTGLPLRYFPKLFLDMLKFARYLFKYRALRKPGFSHLSDKHVKELSIPFEKWVDDKKFIIIGDLLKFLDSMASFSNPEIKKVIPAIGLFKLFLQVIRFPIRYLNGSFKFMAEGYQELWNRVAKQHRVLLDINISKVTRKVDQVEIELDTKEKFIFDKVIVSCSPMRSLDFLDVTPNEKRLFEKTLYAPGWRATFLAKGLPHDSVYAFLEPYISEGYGPFVQTFYPEGQVAEDVWLYSAIVSLNKNTSLAVIKKEAEKAFNQEFNGEILQWLDEFYWPEYVPYFSEEEVEKGIYKELEALQGKNNTYYLGGVVAGSSHATNVDYSYAVIKKFF